MKKLLISVALIFLSLNINAAISQSGITDLKQLNGKQITELISGNTLTGYISEGQFQGKIAVTYGENGSLVMFYVPDDKLYYGKWKVAYLASGGEGNCTKGFDVPSYTCYYWFTGIKDGSKYAYVKRNGQIIFQFHKVESANIQNAEDDKLKKEMDELNAEIKKKADAEKERKKEDLIKAQEKHAKDAGYSSYAVMQAEIKKKADAERERIKIADAERKRKKEQERKKKEQERKKKIEEGKKNLEKQARINSKNNPGFRDLKPGMPYKDYKKICPRFSICYGLQDIKFHASQNFNAISTLDVLTLDMGPITSDGVFIDLINEYANPDANIFRKMKNNFDNKYVLDYEFSTRDRQLFNNNEKNKLLVVYAKGQVALRINRKERKDSYRKDLWLYIEYRDVQAAKAFLKLNMPVKATLNDF